MIDVKGVFSGGLNLDDNLYVVPKDSYVDALNVTTDAIEGSNDRAITNVIGNRLVQYDFPTVALFPEVTNINLLGDYYARISFTGLILAGTVITITLKDSNDDIITIGSYTVQENDTFLDIYNGLKDDINETEAPGVLGANIVNEQLQISHAEGTTITEDNVEIVCSLGENVCIGASPNNVRDTVVYFVWNSIGFHSVLEYNNTSRTISPIFINLTDSDNVDVLGFDKDKKITSVNIYNRDEIIEEGGGLLFFIDSLGRPTTIDIKRFKEKEYSPVTRDILDVCKKPPLFPPLAQYGNDESLYTNNLRINNLKNRLFRFKYRYVYDNNEKSVCSPISTVPLPINILDENFNEVQTNNNKIDIQLTTGDKDVKYIELLMSYVLKSNDWSDFALVESLNKKELFLKTTSETNLSNDPIPLTNITSIYFSGVVIPGITIEVKMKNVVLNQLDLVATYITQSGDSISNILDELETSANAIGLVTPTVIDGKLNIEYPWATYIYDSTLITQPIEDLDNLLFIYSFYNDGTYPVIDVAESIQLFDYVPDLANAQEMPNGNVLLYGGITEGYDRTLNPNVVNNVFTVPLGVIPGGLSEKHQNLSSAPELRDIIKVTMTGIPITGTVIEVYLKYQSNPPYVVGTYTVQEGDDIPKIISGLVNNLNTNDPEFVFANLLQNPYMFSIITSFYNDDPANKYSFNKITITPPEISSSNNSIPTFLFSTQRRIGIAYFDKKGKTNGILYNDRLFFPNYGEGESGLLEVPYINTKVYHKPPAWAHSYGFYLTKEATQFLYWICIKVEEDDDFLYFNITNLIENQKALPTTAQVLSYTFQDGDRFRLIKRISELSPFVFDENYDAPIIGQVKDPTSFPQGTYIKIKKTTIFENETYGEDKFVIQLYRPTQQAPSSTNEVYYEFGQQYGIGNPGEDTRYHLGMVTDQGILPSNLINCSVVSLPFPSIPPKNAATITFSGTPLARTIIDVSITQLPSTNVQLASYVIQQEDTEEDIVNEIFNQISTNVGGYLVSANKNSSTQIEITYFNTVYSFSQTNVTFTYPAADTIPAEFNFYEGDVYIRPRTISVSNGIDTTGFETYNTLDRNFVDNYISAVNSVDGRPSVIDINAKKAYYSTLVRFGQAYQPNTNINGLNRFFPNNFDEYDYSYGDIMRFKVRDRFVRVFQKLKVGQVPLYAQILKEQNKENLVVTDRLLNPIQYYVGDLGIGEHAESLISYNFADYFTSNIKGIIGRVSNDGVKFLSIDHKVDSWATSNLPLRTGNYKVYGGLDQRLGNYIIALEATDTDPAVTLVYDLDLNVFSTFLSYHPEMMTVLGTLFISFKNGELWTHDSPTYNNFYGTQHDSTISLVFNQDPLNKKTFLSVSEIATQIWDVPQMNTDLNSYGNVKMQSNLVNSDFVQLEGNYEAPILRDANSIGGVLEGDSMKGKIMTMKFRASQPTSLVSLNLVSLKSINSPLNAR